MKNYLLHLILLGHLGYLFSQENALLLAPADRNPRDRLIPGNFLTRVNSHEIRLAQSYVKNEMQWVEHFYQQALEDPQQAKTYEQKTRNRARGMTAIVDYVAHAIRAHESSSKVLCCGECLNCIPPNPDSCTSDLSNKLHVSMAVFSSIALGLFAYYLVTSPDKIDILPSGAGVGQCVQMGKGDFLDGFTTNCTNSSWQDAHPFNLTQIEQQYGIDLMTAYRKLILMCRDLADQQCTQWAIEYNKHEYPKKYFKSLLPTMIVAPTVLLGCVGAQLLACKYRRWQAQTGSLHHDATHAKEQMVQVLNRFHAISNSQKLDMKLERLV